MYRTTFFVSMLVIIGTRIKACTVDCGDLCMCVSPQGLGADCSGLFGCYKKCPPGSGAAIGCKSGEGNKFTFNFYKAVSDNRIGGTFMEIRVDLMFARPVYFR